MQYLIISPLGESFESSSTHVDDLSKEIENKLGYKVSQQNLTVNNSNNNSSIVRRRRIGNTQSSGNAHNTTTTVNSTASTTAPMAEDEEVPPPPVTVEFNPSWYPSFLEAYMTLMRLAGDLILAKSEQKFERVKRWHLAIDNCHPHVKTIMSQIVMPFISNLLLVLFGACLLGVCAQISIPLPTSISTVPITGQTFGVLWLGSLTGFVIAPLSVMLYLFCGAVIQIPWFSNQAAGSKILFQSSSSGFLVGFVFSALVCGWFCSKMASDRTIMMNLLMLCLANGVTFVFGCGWLAFGLPNLGLATGIEKGLVPFLPGETIKIVLVLVMVRLSWFVLFRVRQVILNRLKKINSSSSSSSGVQIARVEEGINEQQMLNNVVIGVDGGSTHDVGGGVMMVAEFDEEDNRCLSTCSTITEVQ